MLGSFARGVIRSPDGCAGVMEIDLIHARHEHRATLLRPTKAMNVQAQDDIAYLLDLLIETLADNERLESGVSAYLDSELNTWDL